MKGHLFKHDPTDELDTNKKGLEEDEEQLVQLDTIIEQPAHGLVQLVQNPLLITNGNGH